METSGLNAVIRHVRRVVLVSSSDEDLLVALACRRDEDAFEVLLKRHGPMVWAVCRRVLRHTQDAEDAFQATFLVLIRKSASIRKRTSIASWLYGVAYRCARKAHANNLRRRQVESLVIRPPQTVLTADHADLDGAVDALPEKYRLPVVLCELEGRTRKEAAAVLKIPEGTLSSRLATARKALAKRLGGRSALLGVGVAAPSKVPVPLMMTTMQTGLSLVAGGEAAGVVSGNAILLSQGVLRAMLMLKLKSLVTTVVVLGSLGVGVGSYGHQVLAIGPFGVGAKQTSDARSITPKSESQSAQLHEWLALLQEPDSKVKVAKPAKEETVSLIKQAAIHLEAEVKAKEAALELAQAELNRSRQLYEATTGRLAEVGGQPRVAPVATERKSSSELDFEATLWKLSLDEQRLSAKYGPEHAELQQVRQTIRFIKDLLAKREAGMVSRSRNDVTADQQRYQRTLEAWRDANRASHLDNFEKTPWFPDLARRFQYRIPVVFHDRLEKKGARIEIHDVWGTSPKIQIGGQYIVHGKYEMPNHDKGKLYFHVTSEGRGPNSGPTLELQTLNIDKGSGEFTLMHSLAGPGQFHVQLDDRSGKDGTLANVYFK
jgi:RNA polymerase sigma factor (sigma-70 family)